MDLPTYTNIWRIEKRLYKLYDFRLPFPLPLVTVGVCLGVALVWILLMNLLRVPLTFDPPWHVVWIVPPWVIGFLATRPVIEGKRLTELLRSQALYAAESRVYTRLAPQYEPDRIVVAVRVWRRDPAAGPLPGADRKAVRAAGSAADTAPPATAGAAAEADAKTRVPAPGPERAHTRPVGVRVLNYFGLAMAKPKQRPAPDATTETVPARAGDRTPAARRTELATAKRSADAPSRLTALPDDFEDTVQPGPDSDSPALHRAAPTATSERGRDAARRRAEEIMAAPDPAERAAPAEGETEQPLSAADAPTQPARAADPSAGAGAERAHELARRRLRGRSQSAAVARRLERARAELAEPGETARGYGDALPATQEEPTGGPGPAPARPRPHAAPWDLPPVARTGSGGAAAPAPPEPGDRDSAASPVADTAAGEATAAPPEADPGPPTADGPWDSRPSAADTPAPDRAPDSAEPDPAPDSAEPDPADDADEAADGSADQPAAAEPADPEPAVPGGGGVVGVGGKPRLELDHGTGAWETAADSLRADPSDSAGSPGDAGGTGSASVPGGGGVVEVGGKPRLELDHGTGAWETAADSLRADPSDSAGEPGGPDARPTEADLAAVEQAALRERGADLPDPAGEADTPATPARQPDRLTQNVRSAGTGPATETTAPPSPDPDRDRGAFTRIAQNARRVGAMLTGDNGSAGDGSGAEKPDLQLDHGTGEQELLPGAATVRVVDGAPTGIPGVVPDDVPEPEHHETETGHTRAAPAADPPTGATRGWRRLARVVTGANAANTRPQLPPADVERLRTPFDGARRIVVLGCTGGAGQTVTALMLGHTLAAYRDERVVAVDINPGPQGLSRRIRTESPETLTSLLANADSVHGYLGLRGYTSQSPSGLEVVATLDDPYVQTLDDRDYASLTGMLERHYKITLLDPAATGVARALPIADSLVLVAPASSDAARAVALTFEWLDGHGYADLRANAVVVVNGVSKRSLPDVDAAEQVARGGCRAIVRIPWDDHVSAARAVIDVDALRPTTRRAHAALAGVVAAGLAETEPAAHSGTEANR